jgi:hypothetical protein
MINSGVGKPALSGVLILQKRIQKFRQLIGYCPAKRQVLTFTASGPSPEENVHA